MLTVSGWSQRTVRIAPPEFSSSALAKDGDVHLGWDTRGSDLCTVSVMLKFPFL